MKILPARFETPIQIGDLDCLVTLKIDSYFPPSDGFFNPLNGDGEAPHDGCLEFLVEGIRLDRPGSKSEEVNLEWSAFLEQSNQLRQACLEAIEEANQPPED